RDAYGEATPQMTLKCPSVEFAGEMVDGVAAIDLVIRNARHVSRDDQPRSVLKAKVQIRGAVQIGIVFDYANPEESAQDDQFPFRIEAVLGTKIQPVYQIIQACWCHRRVIDKRLKSTTRKNRHS